MGGLVLRVIGVIALVVAGLTAVLYGLGTWNPWQLVFLEYRFGNPALGLLVTALALLVGSWLAVPIRSETRPRGRLAFRITAFVLTLLGLFAYGLFGEHFKFDTRELAVSEDGQLRLAMVSDRDVPPGRQLKVWAGSGLGLREVGDLGKPCGSVQARFIGNDQVELDTAYGTWVIELDPATGEPQQILGARCSDPPVPATLGS